MKTDRDNQAAAPAPLRTKRPARTQRDRASLSLSEYRRATLLTRECTKFDSFAALLKACGVSPAGYRPVLYTDQRPTQLRRPRTTEQLQAEHAQLRRNNELADLYDRAQQARGDVRRAVRI